MNVDVVLHAGLLPDYDLKGKTVVVIDAFRATSVIVEGLYNRGASFVPVESVDEARSAKEQNAEILIGGERDGVVIDGFDLDNSPLSYIPEKVAGKEIWITTTNGTRALKGAIAASQIYVGTFLNLFAVARQVVGAKDVVFVCSGSENQVSLEDSVCAGGILYEMELLASISYSDVAYMLKSLYTANRQNLKEFLSKGTHYQYLADKGFIADIDFCLQVNKRNVVPSFDGTTIRV